MSRLDKYQSKRRFEVTPEPAPTERESGPRLLYGIQKHDATRLHYDLRLEHNGAMLSWAVPKGPSLDPAEKRLAVHVEDHPIEYMHFEGRIPKGEYGAGTVLVWDIGWWEPLRDVETMLREGEMKFKLHGERLQGAWTLIRIKGDEKNWLFIKEKDKYAIKGDADGVVGRCVTSVLSPKIDAEPLNIETFSPQLAETASSTPLGNRWVHEVKFDGYRITAWKIDDSVKLLSRNRLDWTHRFKHLAEALASLPDGTVLDGEVVVLDKNGISDFGALQQWLKTGKGLKPVYCVFDLLQESGMNITGLPLLDRKSRLRKVLEQLSAEARVYVLYSEHMVGGGDKFFRAANENGLEGVISKYGDSPYVQSRTRQWLKSKCIKQEEFVIGGFTRQKGSGKGLGALLVGQFGENGKLVYAGKVGTGFSEKTSAELQSRLEPIVVENSPFESVDPEDSSGAIWVTPELVAQIKFGERTKTNRLRHPVFLGLRSDKAARDVMLETVPLKPLSIKISNPDKVLFPDIGLTKGALAEYYQRVGEEMLPHIKGRPLSVVRSPDGIHVDQFFQKHESPGMPPEVLGQVDGESILKVENVQGILTLVQFGAIELHPWGSRCKSLEKPDTMVFDLDPSPDVDWPIVVQAAEVVGEFLRSMNFTPFLKTSGGKGLHVVVPIKAGSATWEDFKRFAKLTAEKIDRLVPGFFVTTISKSRRKHRILIDYLRNGRGATSVAPFSVRARTGAPVSAPLAWSDLRHLPSATHFSVLNVAEWFVQGTANPWHEFRKAERSIGQAAWKAIA
jgi:bifunctional non-homologous end joining protein LigD